MALGRGKIEHNAAKNGGGWWGPLADAKAVRVQGPPEPGAPRDSRPAGTASGAASQPDAPGHSKSRSMNIRLSKPPGGHGAAEYWTGRQGSERALQRAEMAHSR